MLHSGGVLLDQAGLLMSMLLKRTGASPCSFHPAMHTLL